MRFVAIAVVVVGLLVITPPQASADNIASKVLKRWPMHKLEDWAANKLDLDRKEVEQFVEKLRENRVDAYTLFKAWREKDLSVLLKKMDLGWNTRRKIENAINSYFESDQSLADTIMEAPILQRFKSKESDSDNKESSGWFSGFTLNPIKWAWWGFTTFLSIGWSLFKFLFKLSWGLFVSPFRTVWTLFDVMGLAFLLTRKRHASASSPDSAEPTEVEVQVPDATQISLNKFLSSLDYAGRMLFGDRLWGFARYGFARLPSSWIEQSKSAVNSAFVYSRVYARTLLGENSNAYRYMERSAALGLELFAWSFKVLGVYQRVRHYAILGMAFLFFGSVFSIFVPSFVLYPIKALIWRIGDVGALYMLWSFMRWHSSHGKIAQKGANIHSERVQDQTSAAFEAPVKSGKSTQQQSRKEGATSAEGSESQSSADFEYPIKHKRQSGIDAGGVSDKSAAGLETY